MEDNFKILEIEYLSKKNLTEKYFDQKKITKKFVRAKKNSHGTKPKLKILQMKMTSLDHQLSPESLMGGVGERKRVRKEKKKILGCAFAVVLASIALTNN